MLLGPVLRPYAFLECQVIESYNHGMSRLWPLLIVLSAASIPAACADDTPPALVDVTQLADTTDTVGPYTVTAVAKDDRGIDSVTLYYTADQAADARFKAVEMQRVQGDLFSGEMSGFPGGAVVRYFVEAKDTSANRARAPAEADRYYQFSVRE